MCIRIYIFSFQKHQTNKQRKKESKKAKKTKQQQQQKNRRIAGNISGKTILKKIICGRQVKIFVVTHISGNA